MDVNKTFDFHFSPPKLLYILAETYPAGVPNNTKSIMTQVINAPRFAGLKNPKQANANVTNVIQNTCTPDPRNTDNNIPFLGGLNTSPCTSFQPNSSYK